MKMILPAIASVLLVAQSGAAGTSPSEIQWRRDYESARIEAARAGRPILIVVRSAGCGWCRRLEQTTLKDPDVIGAVGRTAVPVTLGADNPRNEGMMAALGIQGVPGLVMVDSRGKILARHEGYLDPRQFLTWFRVVTGR